MALALGRVKKAPIALGRVKYVTREEAAQHAEYARKGVEFVRVNPMIEAARRLVDNGAYRRGFDIATGLCAGLGTPGPSQSAVRRKLGAGFNDPLTNIMGSHDQVQGFDAGQAIQHGMTKAMNESGMQGAQNESPNVAAGMFLANGLAGSGSPEEVKRNALLAAAGNPGTAAGATRVANAKIGLWGRFCAFFGV